MHVSQIKLELGLAQKVAGVVLHDEIEVRASIHCVDPDVIWLLVLNHLDLLSLLIDLFKVLLLAETETSLVIDLPSDPVGCTLEHNDLVLAR